MALQGKNNGEKIWNYLLTQGLTEAGAAGLMGNLYAESGLKPNNLQNTANARLGLSDDEYTRQTDNGVYDNFIRDGAGYGLAQWTYYTRKEALLSFCYAMGRSVGDLEAQLGFLSSELASLFPALLDTLRTIQDARAASDFVLTRYERPANISQATRDKRAGYAEDFLKRFGSATGQAGRLVSEAERRRLVVNTAQLWMGAKQGDSVHRDIIDTYNSYLPHPRGHVMSYTEPWCAAFVSAVGIRAGLSHLMPPECSCGRMISAYKTMGRWKEDDAYMPAMGDLVMYDWQDDGQGDCTGQADHVGIVSGIIGASITVIEGNKANQVGLRKIQRDGRYIRGFCLPPFHQ